MSKILLESPKDHTYVERFTEDDKEYVRLVHWDECMRCDANNKEAVVLVVKRYRIINESHELLGDSYYNNVKGWCGNL